MNYNPYHRPMSAWSFRQSSFVWPWSLLASAFLVLLALTSCQQRATIDKELYRAKLYPVDNLEALADTATIKSEVLKLSTKGQQVDSLLILVDRMKDFDSRAALFYADMAYQVASGENWDLQRAISLYYIALMKRSLQTWGGGIEDALVDAEMSQLLFERLGRKDWLIRVYDLIGIIHFRQSEQGRKLKLDTARAYFKRALIELEMADLSSSDSLAVLAEILHDLGTTYEVKGEDKAIAKEYLEASYENYEITDNPLGLARLRNSLAGLLAQEPTIVPADSMYNLNETFAKAHRNNNLLAEVYLKKSILYRNHFWNTSNPGFFDKALKELQKRLELSLDDSYFTYNMIGEVYQTKAAILYNTSQKNNFPDSVSFYYDEAYNFLDSALYYYKIAIEGAREKGILTIMDELTINIFSNCLEKRLVNKGDCVDIFMQKVPKFISSSYKIVTDHMTVNSVQANRLIRERERIESDKMAARKRRNLIWISAAVILILGLIFLLFLQLAEQKKLRAQMKALRAQINPHFISNSLNAIENLVNQGENKAASKYLISFSRLSRRILNGSRDLQTTLAQEVETLRLFLNLEQLRFRDKLQFDIKVGEDLAQDQVLIPAMVLQPYIENAIWHGIKPKSGTGQLTIEIKKEDQSLLCTVEDNGIGREKSRALQANSVLQRKSHGMKITEERLKATGKLRGSAVKIIDLKDDKGTASGTKVFIRLPLRLKKI